MKVSPLELRTPDVAMRQSVQVLTGAPASGADASFAGHLVDVVGQVDAAQQGADAEAQKLAFGEGNLHEAALTLEKADISMRLMMKARNKIVEAYQEVSRMQI